MITHARCLAYFEDLLDGVHQPGDEYCLALYTDAAELDEETTAYTPAGEVIGEGYEAGGALLSGRRRERYTVPEPIGNGQTREVPVVGLTFDNPVWLKATLAADGALLYNRTRGYRAMVVLRFLNAPVRSTNAPFRVSLATADVAKLLQLR